MFAGAWLLFQQNLNMGGGPVGPVVAAGPAIFLTNAAQRSVVVSGAGQRNTVGTGNVQRSVAVGGNAGAN